ncbi:copper resistance protein CopC [Peribacillus simplex]|uniref:copper resistance CopC/CopD family protein n=1 Tax=Peribacillus simplex TaxID=1478 RepID=UPI003D2CDB91
MIKKRQSFIFLSFTIVFLFLMGANKVWSHAFVVKESPAPNSQHGTSPKEVTITFNSKVEKNLVSIKVIDERQQEVTSQSAQLSNNQQEIRLQLPQLAEGIYNVQYYAISSNDGHSIRGSYHFKVAAAVPIQQPDGEASESEVVSSGQTDQMLDEVNLTDSIIYIIRAIYYIGLLLTIGWVFWWRYIQDYSAELKKRYLFWGILIQMIHLVGLISMILVQLNIFTSNGLSFAPDFPFGTIFGLMWFSSLFVSLIGFVCLFRNKWFDLLWILIIIVSKSLNGHSLEFEPTSVLVISNCIHLFAASIWAAGLTFTIVFWRKQRLYVQSFLPLFSRVAFLSIVILSITGVFSAIAFLSNFNLLLTNWGLFLLYKLFAVILVVSVGGIIRSKLKKQKTMDLGIWIKVDFILMMTIIILVSILSYLNPLP